MSRPVFPKAIPKEKQMSLPAESNENETEAKPLSFQELHQRLKNRLQSQNILNDMRAELRSRLVHELYEIAEPQEVPRVASTAGLESQLPIQISNWLVCNHFQRGNFEFTLSTFLRESGIVTLPEYNMTFHDVLYVLGIHPNTEFYKAIREKYASEKNSGGLLFLIVQQLLLCVLPQSMKSYSEGSVQTESPTMYEEKTHQKVLHEIEHLRKKVDEELKAVLQVKTKQGSVGMGYICVNCNKERQDGLSLLDSYKHEIGRLEKLLKSSENDLKKQKERLEEELLLKTQEIETRILTQWNKREGDFKNIQDKLHKDNKRMEEEGLVLEDMRTSLDKSQLKVRELESQLELLKEQINIQQKQNKSLQAMLESMADYEVVKSELTVTKRELELALSRYQNAQNQWLSTKDILEKKIAELTLKITSPCLELMTANTEVQRMIEKQEQDQTAWNKERGHLQKELHREKLRVEEQRQHIENLNKIIQSLQLQLENADISSPQANILFSSKNLTSSVSNSKPAVSSDRLSPTSSPQSRVSYLQEAKKRIEKLQAEADVLESKYGQFMKNQRTILSPTETFFSPFTNPRVYFNHPSYINSNMSFGGSTTPKINSFFLDERYQVTPQLGSVRGTLKETYNLQNYLSNTSFDDGTKKKVDPGVRIAPPTQNVHNYPFSKTDPILTDFLASGTGIQQVDKTISSVESLANNAFVPTKDGSVYKSSHFNNATNTTQDKTALISDIKPLHFPSDVNELGSSAQSNLTFLNSKGLIPGRITSSLPKVDPELSVEPTPVTEPLPLRSDEVLSDRTLHENPTSQKNVNNSHSSVLNTVASSTNVLQSENKNSHEMKSSFHQDVPVNLDSEWKKVRMPALVNNPRNKPLEINLDDAWKKQTIASNTSVDDNNYALKKVENEQNLFQPSNEEPANKNSNSNNVFNIKEFEVKPNDELLDVSLHVTDDEVYETKHIVEKNDVHAMEIHTSEISASVNSVQVNDADQTKAGVFQDSSFVPKNHSTPLAPPTVQDTDDNNDDVKSDSDINLSIGDQAAQSGNSNSESLW